MALEPMTYEMPFNMRIEGGLYPESKVELEGLILEQSERFHIELANGQHKKAKALKLEVCFEDYPYVTIVSRNCFKDKVQIERSPLKPGGRFKIEIQVTRNSYKIIANGQFLAEFPHCFPPKDAIFLEMDGGVILEKLSLPAVR